MQIFKKQSILWYNLVFQQTKEYMSGSSKKAVLTAFAANSGIAIAKTAGAVITGSGTLVEDRMQKQFKIKWSFFEPDIEK